MKLETPIYSGSLVKWEGNQGITDCTTLKVDKDKLPFSHLYDDNSLLGLRVKSHKTGVEKKFILVRVERNDYDHVAWLLESIDKRYRITIFND